MAPGIPALAAANALTVLGACAPFGPVPVTRVVQGVEEDCDRLIPRVHVIHAVHTPVGPILKGICRKIIFPILYPW
jgi:hypothetical protein